DVPQLAGRELVARMAPRAGRAPGVGRDVGPAGQRAAPRPPPVGDALDQHILDLPVERAKAERGATLRPLACPDPRFVAQCGDPRVDSCLLCLIQDFPLEVHGPEELMSAPQLLVHEKKDTVGVVVVEGLKAGTEMTAVVTADNSAVQLKATIGVTIG